MHGGAHPLLTAHTRTAASLPAIRSSSRTAPLCAARWSRCTRRTRSLQTAAAACPLTLPLFNNSFKNGLLPIVLSEGQVSQLFADALAFPGYALTIDLERQVVVKPDGEELPFEVQAFRKYCLLNGFDDIGLTLRHADKIKIFEAERLANKPWLARTIST